MGSIERQENSAVLFADISGSTKLYVRSGDERARAIVARTLDLWSQLTTGGGGSVIQLRGDGMLCMFPTVDAALTAAVVRMRDLPYQAPLSMHAGLECRRGLARGRAALRRRVNVAARMADVAKKFEIVLTEAAHLQLLEPDRWPNLRLIARCREGQDRADEHLSAAERAAGLTDYRPPLNKTVIGCGSTCSRDASDAVEAQAGVCLIGRDEDCRIKVEHRLVSRRHASIECVAGKFFLQDHSTNGTYVEQRARQTGVRPARDLPAQSSGVISFGVEPQHNVEHSILYSFEK